MASFNSSEIVRPTRNFLPSLWDNHFASFSLDHKEVEKYTKEIRVLKEEVRNMVVATDRKQNEKMNLIDALERLGVSYHFEKEIEEQLEQIFKGSFDDQDYDLCTTATQFRVFRQHGYYISSDVFNKFKDSNGEFKKSITSDVMGMVSLYEAAHLRVHGEESLDEALAFATVHLKSMVDTLSPGLAKYVLHALEQPLHIGVPRLEARHYIYFYQQNTSRDESLLRLAMLDYNFLQLLHKQELSQLTKWWNDLDLAPKLPYARNGLVELYLWSMATYSQPCFALGRIIAAKVLCFISTLDDTFDSYGTLEELESFTNAVKRWDISSVDQLPHYMKPLYKALLDLYKQLEEEMTKQGKSFAFNVAKDAMKGQVEAYYVEAKWYNKVYVPTYEEYMENARISSSLHLILVSFFLGMGELAPSKEKLDWIQARPKLVTVMETIGRLANDIASHEEEQQKGDVATAIECLRKQHRLTREEAVFEARKRIEDAWKYMNKELLRPTSVPTHIVMGYINQARVNELVYKYHDGYTHSEKVTKDHIISLFVDPIIVP